LPDKNKKELNSEFDKAISLDESTSQEECKIGEIL
jgi:hypothetical protein